MTLVKFLTARLDEDEAAALLCPPWPWVPNDEIDTVIAEDGEDVAEVFALSNNQLRNTTRFIVRNEPGRTLREVAAKRAIVKRLAEQYALGWPSPDEEHYAARDVLSHLASVYADHPDYDDDWKL